ncbi:MAG: class I mannose-6-phosphate isomerase [Verrucomicrobiota bacterium JB024]|nr:class I mannose-6-phosphate isomerase [Verrucomicrobiota bacterium JB024]
MSYLQKLGLGKASYDLKPFVAVDGYNDACWRGWDTIVAQLKSTIAEQSLVKTVVAVECYSGIIDEEVVPSLRDGLQPKLWIESEREAFKPSSEIDTLLAPDLGGDDPIFGRLTRLTLEDFLDPEKRDHIRARIDAIESGLVVVYGPGSLLCCEPDISVYADMARWEAQLRQRANRISNLGVNNRELKASLQYKRSFFIDWRVCDKLKRATFAHWDFLLDTCTEGDPKLISGDAFRAGLIAATQRPFRVVPFFDPGVWGGQWMREVCNLPDGPPNYAWCFDCVPEENSLLLGFGETRVEVPSLDLVFAHPVELLGEPVYGRYGAEFPIRFDFLDTMRGQNLSFQVHPLIDYAHEHFGLRYTQDESYYILDAEPEAEVYLGLKDDVDPKAMLADLKAAAEDPAKPFPDTKHVQRFPAKKHDHFLIPAGTCHCSGANSMVLEISHTPYIFTFKLWDWARLDLNGLPRPINLERGAANIQWDRTRSWVEPRLVNAIEPVSTGEGWREERTGLYQSEAFETRRHWFTGTVPHDTRHESVHVLNLAEGAEAVVESPDDAFVPFVVHYAETFIVPASVGKYTIRPHGPAVGKECATMKAFLRVNA